MTIRRIGIVGLGLIGGSFARLLKERVTGSWCVAADADGASLVSALTDRVIDLGVASDAEFPHDLDLILVCTPIEVTRDILLRLAKRVPPTCIVADVASVKQAVLEGLETFPNVVGAHPIAGTEFSGYSASSAEIMKDAPFIVVPTAANTSACDRFSSFLSDDLGFKVAKLSAKDHDTQIAATSHLPYLMASLTAEQARVIQPHPLLFGPGFASTTRVSKSNPDWGVAVCKTNKEALLSGLRHIQEKASEIETLIHDENWDQLKAILSGISLFRKDRH